MLLVDRQGVAPPASLEQKPDAPFGLVDPTGQLARCFRMEAHGVAFHESGPFQAGWMMNGHTIAGGDFRPMSRRLHV